MKNHTVTIDTTKKDKDGFIKLLVRFGEWYIPILGKPVPLIEEDFESITDEGEGEYECIKKIKRLNFTRWILKDIPKIANLISSLADGDKSWLFYYSENEDSWKFYDAPFAGINEDADDFDERIDKLNKLIKRWDKQFYRPHYDHRS